MDHSLIIFLGPLVIGYLLDLLLGDPRWLPHPIRLFGTTIYLGEKLLNKGKFRFIKGIFLTFVLCSFVFLFFYFLSNILLEFNPILYSLFACLFIFYGLANKSLIQEGKEVFNTLEEKGIEAGRKRLSWIVGRDTTTLSENQIRIAVFETLSENLSDGVIAPLFYYAIGGLPFMMTYKMINTLDSMIGYKSDRYFYFGKFAARLDDVVNYVPARITAFLMIIISGKPNLFSFVLKFGNQHASPNSGYPESALAAIMNCRFGGPNIYYGKLVEKPFIGINTRIIKHSEFKKVSFINHAVALISIVTILLIKCSIFYFFNNVSR
ncbi:cobalamin biosynthesis protein CobD [Flavobacterium columnare]|uniref:Cobalamin biosynthesis protein CobD n=2 Tax=Flavobacterium TaxID=237 RepID=A0A437U8I5_9FLAO|nr:MULTISPECIES: adenosylcobinamide-phosphate synthase CbiB [Flavobacterium]QYS88761.1 cobalamin biosynthesis protein CobD [Flavobacterium davisii]RVU89939.1 cobalamin biosynthesis protein CobD [Flavobacterium columnare]